MKVVIAIDSFKGSMTSLEAGNAAKEGILKVFPEADIVVQALADGGEGTMEALNVCMGGETEKIKVTGPSGNKIECTYGIIPQSKVAIIEMASAAGLTLLAEEERNPLYTTTFGVGEIVCDAIRKGCRHFIIGIGGSATNDGGIGFLQALGYDILDVKGKPVSLGAIGLRDIELIKDDNVIPELRECTFCVACDVINPLCGPTGCSTVYGKQKGASDQMIKDMDIWLARYAEISKKYNKLADDKIPGTGAAGGMGYALLTYTNATLESGAKIVFEESGLEKKIEMADIVVTGEGKMDAQTIMGKAPIQVSKMAKKYNKKVIAFAGVVSEQAAVCNVNGIDAFFPIIRTVDSLENNMDKENARNNMVASVEQVFRVIKLFE